MNTRFQISRTFGSSMLTKCAASRPPMRSKWISLHGPHGPVSPISQKLSFILPGRIRLSSILGPSRGKREISYYINNSIHLVHILYSPQVQPDLLALQVRLQACISMTTKISHIEAFNRYAKLLRQQLQCHLAGQVLDIE